MALDPADLLACVASMTDEQRVSLCELLDPLARDRVFEGPGTVMGRQPGKSTRLAAIGLDWKAEQDRMLEEQTFVAAAGPALRTLRDAVAAANAEDLHQLPLFPDPAEDDDPIRDVVIQPTDGSPGLLAARLEVRSSRGLVRPRDAARPGVEGFGDEIVLTATRLVAPRAVFTAFLERFGDVTKAAGNHLRIIYPGLDGALEVRNCVVTAAGPAAAGGDMVATGYMTLMGTKLDFVADTPPSNPTGEAIRRNIKAMHEDLRGIFRTRQTPKSTTMLDGAGEIRITPLDCGGVMDAMIDAGLTAKDIKVRCVRPAQGEDKGQATITLRHVTAPEPVFLATLIRYGDARAVRGNVLRVSRGRPAGDLEIRDCVMGCSGPHTVADGMLTVETLEILGSDTRRIPARALRGVDEPVAVSLECPPLRDADEEAGPSFIVAEFDDKTKAEILKHGWKEPIVAPARWFEGDIRELLSGNSIKDQLAEADALAAVDRMKASVARSAAAIDAVADFTDTMAEAVKADRELRSPRAIEADAARTDRTPPMIEAGHPDPVWTDPSPAVIEAAVADGNMVTATSTWDDYHREYIPDDVAMLRQLQANSRKHAGPAGEPGAESPTWAAKREALAAGVAAALVEIVAEDPALLDRWTRATRRWDRLFGEGPIPAICRRTGVDVSIDAIEGMLYDKETRGVDPARCRCGCVCADPIEDDPGTAAVAGAGPSEADVAAYWAAHDADQLAIKDAQARWAQAQSRWRHLFGDEFIPMERAALPALALLEEVEAILYDKESKGIEPTRCGCGGGHVVGCVAP